MDSFDKVDHMGDKRWTNIIKRDLIKEVVQVREADKNNRLIALKVEAEAKDWYSTKLKERINAYQNVLKLAKNDNKEKILNGVAADPILIERFKNLTPRDIELSIALSIQKIVRERNAIQRQNKLQVIELKKLKKFESNKSVENTTAMNKMVSKIADMETKIAAAELTNRKTEAMVKLLKENIIMYDSLTAQLEKDAEELAVEGIKTIETGTTFKEDEGYYTQKYIEEKKANIKAMEKKMAYIGRLLSKENLLEHNRSLLMQEPQMTDLEKTIRTKLPSVFENQPDNKTVQEISNKWYDTFLKDGLMGFVNEEYKRNIQNHLKAEYEYEFPEELQDFLTIDNNFPTKDEVAADYVLKELGFGSKEEMLQSLEFDKQCYTRLIELNALKSLMWKLAMGKLEDVCQLPETLHMMSNAEIEYEKQKKILQPLIDEQMLKLRQVEEADNHYVKLFNEMIFSLENFEAKLQKIQVPILRHFHLVNRGEKNYRKELYGFLEKIDPCPQLKPEELVRSAQNELTKGASEIELSVVDKCMQIIDRLENKFYWCMKIVEDFNQKNLTTAIAYYEYESQRFMQKQQIKNDKEQNVVAVRPDSRDLGRDTGIMSRDQRKVENQEIVDYFNAPKDTDDAKNTRKPISFRADKIVLKAHPK